jgi:hypothetical protein
MVLNRKRRMEGGRTVPALSGLWGYNSVYNARAFLYLLIADATV